MSELKHARPISRFVAGVIGCSVASVWAQQAPPAADPPAKDPARPQEQEKLEEVVVRGLSFKYDKTVESATKMPMSVKDTPQTVKIVTNDMMDFSGVTTLNELYKLDAGSHANHNIMGYSWTYFRGFRNEFHDSFKIDGFRVYPRSRPDFAPYERLEIVKGATSTLYGQASVAGTVNVISKQPQPQFGGAITLEAGSYDHYRGMADFYGPLTDDGRLTFRMVGAYVDEKSYLDFAFRRVAVVAPSLKYQFTDDTSLLVQVNYQKLDYLPSEGYPPQFVGSDPDNPSPEDFQFPDVPRSRLGDAAWANADRTSIFARAYLEHRFDSGWMLRANLQYSEVSGLVKRAWFQTADPQGFTDTYLYFDDTKDPAYSGEVNLFGNFEAFGREHTLFFGVDATKLDSYTEYAGAPYPSASLGLNIYDPDYSLLPDPTSLDDFTPGGAYGDTGSFWGGYVHDRYYGFTAQTLLKPTDRLSVLLGARYSHSTRRYNVGGVTSFEELNPYTTDPSTSKVTFQSGVTYKLSQSMNAYATYGETFTPRAGFAFDPSDPDGAGTPLGPEEGVTYEVGLKGDLLNQQLSWSMGLFNTERTNIAEQDPDNPRYSIALGVQRSRGVEVDFQGEIVNGWDVYGSLVWMDNEFIDGALSGKPSPLGPKFGMALYSSYQLQGGALQGLGFGGGVVHHKMPEFYDNATGLFFPHLFGDYTEVDARVFYDFDAWRVQLSATNLLNEKYYAPSYLFRLDGGIHVNPPRQFLMEVTRKF